jgi:hypothetical protein
MTRPAVISWPSQSPAQASSGAARPKAAARPAVSAARGGGAGDAAVLDGGGEVFGGLDDEGCGPVGVEVVVGDGGAEVGFGADHVPDELVGVAEGAGEAGCAASGERPGLAGEAGELGRWPVARDAAGADLFAEPVPGPGQRRLEQPGGPGQAAMMTPTVVTAVRPPLRAAVSR